MIAAMHVLFVHKNFPAQFGHIASHLVRERGWECTFVSERPSRELGGVRTIQYAPHGALAERALEVLDDPGRFRELGRGARGLVQERYGMDVVMPEMTSFYSSVALSR